MVTVILIFLALLGIAFLVMFVRDYHRHRRELGNASKLTLSLLGSITNVFDVFGIGNFAPITVVLRALKITPDKLIPGTLNVCTTIPVIIESFIFIKVIEVHPATLIGMFAAATIGAYIGAGIISKISEQKIRLVMGVALFATAFMMFMGAMGWMPGGGDEIGLNGYKLALGIAGNFILGALMTAGIGLYAPCMALVYFLGMSPKVSFPIMMGSCAILMPIASVKFIREGAYDRKASMWLMLSGIVGVLFATYLIKSMSIETLRWIVMLVVFYTSVSMLKTYLKSRASGNGNIAAAAESPATGQAPESRENAAAQMAE